MLLSKSKHTHWNRSHHTFVNNICGGVSISKATGSVVWCFSRHICVLKSVLEVWISAGRLNVYSFVVGLSMFVPLHLNVLPECPWVINFARGWSVTSSFQVTAPIQHRCVWVVLEVGIIDQMPVAVTLLGIHAKHDWYLIFIRRILYPLFLAGWPSKTFHLRISSIYTKGPPKKVGKVIHNKRG